MAFMTPRRCLKFALALALVVFLIINTSYLWVPFQHDDGKNAVRVVHDKPSNSPIVTATAKQPQDIVVQVKKAVEVGENKQSDTNQSARTDNSESTDKRLLALNESLSFIIEDINSAQKIRNIDKFPPNEDNTYKHVFVVQVHDRDHYFQHLLHSLQLVKDANKSLLIVSHDYYSKEVFNLVESVTYMPVSSKICHHTDTFSLSSC